MERGIVGKGAGSREITVGHTQRRKNITYFQVYSKLTLKIKLWKTIHGMTSIKFQ